jgi:hypothetical protein
MKNLTLALVLTLGLLVGGCAENLHKPTTAGNAGTTALVAYAVAGFTAGKYFALPTCNAPPVYPCKTQSINDRLLLADTAAYNAAKAADAAGASQVEKDNAIEKIAELKRTNASPEVQTQVALIKPAGATP